jgi:acyl carrier protein
MMPLYFVRLSEIPLTSNGKVDKNALPAPNQLATLDEFIAPTTDTQIKLAQIWAELLNVELEKLSASAHFFKLGGHSIQIMRLISQIKKSFTVDIDMSKVFEISQLNELAAFIDQSTTEQDFDGMVKLTKVGHDETLDDDDMEAFEL